MVIIRFANLIVALLLSGISIFMVYLALYQINVKYLLVWTFSLVFIEGSGIIVYIYLSKKYENPPRLPPAYEPLMPIAHH